MAVNQSVKTTVQKQSSQHYTVANTLQKDSYNLCIPCYTLLLGLQCALTHEENKDLFHPNSNQIGPNKLTYKNFDKVIRKYLTEDWKSPAIHGFFTLVLDIILLQISSRGPYDISGSI
eukprot:UN22769